jgi:hypothetical protein
MYFSRNTPNNIKESIFDIPGVTKEMWTRYESSMIGRNNKAMFEYLKDRMWMKIHIWSGDDRNSYDFFSMSLG